MCRCARRHRCSLVAGGERGSLFDRGDHSHHASDDESGSRQVDLGEVEICSPELIGAAAHGDGFIVLDWQTRPEGRFGVLLEVDLDGTLAGFVTPWLDGMGGVTGAWPAE